MLIKLTHPEPNYEFYIEHSEISALERYMKVRSELITMMTDDKPDVTAIVMKSGRIFSCKETPKQILALFPKTNQELLTETEK